MQGGIAFTAAHKDGKLDLDAVKAVLSEYRWGSRTVAGFVRVPARLWPSACQGSTARSSDSIVRGLLGCRIHNADVHLHEDYDIDDLVDVIEGGTPGLDAGYPGGGSARAIPVGRMQRDPWAPWCMQALASTFRPST